MPDFRNAAAGYRWFKAVAFALLTLNTAVFVAYGTASAALDSLAWLTLLFSFIFVPLSIVWRLTGKDPLGRRRQQWPGWSPYPVRYRDRTHYTRMY